MGKAQQKERIQECCAARNVVHGQMINTEQQNYYDQSKNKSSG